MIIIAKMLALVRCVGGWPPRCATWRAGLLSERREHAR
jgi:hypothetical protein